MKTGLVYLRPANLVAFRSTGPYHRSSTEAWERMFAWMSRHGLRGKVHRGYGMALDDPRKVPAAQCRYDACIEMPDQLPTSAWSELLPQRLPGGPYARLRYVGPHSELSGIAKNLREQWTGKHGLSVCSRRPMIEIYLDDPQSCRPENLRTDLCLPIAFSSARAVA